MILPEQGRMVFGMLNLMDSDTVCKGWSAHSPREGVRPLSIYEALMFAVTFAALCVAIMESTNKK